ncbi:hypothetical protein GMORB2_5603 [Geosmithia morbida]|uniref:Uncharacterized protein n=1 Tax=Geosmithia morbida TaxID=1094350 RepID=A0A9P5D2I1_9HYPO|nr:uncharacterized protein GMORB2_5603 [Geosmithia morbida]KAF4123887.1 hypothetical protein GMORB2_5603 [Geosmithia morbida]
MNLQEYEGWVRGRTGNSTSAKPGSDDYLPDVPPFRGSIVSENNSDIVEESLASNDSMALKGQVWPGMGKLDLATDDVRRTRNQRKPKWVVEKMRKASERIEPNQVIMSPQLVVERVKCVYDEELSVSEEDQSPRKSARQKRKKPQPLAEISGNVPRETKEKRPKGRSWSTVKSEKKDTRRGQEQKAPSKTPRSANSDLRGGEQEDGKYPTYTLNPISHSALSTPTHVSDGIPLGTLPERDEPGSLAVPSFFGHSSNSSLGPYPEIDTGYEIDDANFFPHSIQPDASGFIPTEDVEHVHYQPPVSHQAPPRRNEYTREINEVSLGELNSSLFFDLANTSSNPLLSHGRSWSNSYNPAAYHQPVSPPGISQANRSFDCGFPMIYDAQPRDRPLYKVKTEPKACSTAERHTTLGERSPNFSSHSFWPPQHCENNPASHKDPNPETFAL